MPSPKVFHIFPNACPPLICGYFFYLHRTFIYILNAGGIQPEGAPSCGGFEGFPCFNELSQAVWEGRDRWKPNV